MLRRSGWTGGSARSGPRAAGGRADGRSSSRSGIQSSTPRRSPARSSKRLEQQCRHPSGEAVEVGVRPPRRRTTAATVAERPERRHRLEHPDHRPVEHRPPRTPDHRAEDVVASQATGPPARGAGAGPRSERDDRARSPTRSARGDQPLGQLARGCPAPKVAVPLPVADLEQDRQGTVVVRGLEELLRRTRAEVSARRGAGHHPGELPGPPGGRRRSGLGRSWRRSSPLDPRPSRASSHGVHRKAEEGGDAPASTTDDNAARCPWGGAQQDMGIGVTAFKGGADRLLLPAGGSRSRSRRRCSSSSRTRSGRRSLSSPTRSRLPGSSATTAGVVEAVLAADLLDQGLDLLPSPRRRRCR